MTVKSPTKPTLELNANQRAMLAEMGIFVWLPVVDDQAVSQPQAAPELSAAAVEQPKPTPQKTAPTPAPVVKATTEKTTSCQACAPYLNAQPPANMAMLPIDKTLPRWLFVLDSISQDAAGTPPKQDKSQLLLQNMAAALRLQDTQINHCHACDCFRLALENTKQAPTAQCSAWLLHEIMRIQPQIIVALGRQAAFSLLGTTAPLGSLRNTTHHLKTPQPDVYPEWILQVPVLVSYPLDYLLRTPAAKARAWQDLCLAHSVVSC